MEDKSSQTDDYFAGIPSSDCAPCRCQVPKSSSSVRFGGHDYIVENDFDVLVNANHDYYSRVLQQSTDDKLNFDDHSYAFNVGSTESNCTLFDDAAAAFSFGQMFDVDTEQQRENYGDIDTFVEGIANLDEHMGICSSTMPSCVTEDVTSIDLTCTVSDDQVCTPQELDCSAETSKKLFCCRWDTCNEKYHSAKRLLRHFHAKHLSVEQNVCLWSDCSEKTTFKNVTMLLHHAKSHIGSVTFVCNVCCKTFEFRFRLNEHMLRHTNVARHCCPTCNKRFAFKCDYRRHLATHASNCKYFCKVCHKRYKDASGLRKHRLKDCSAVAATCANILSILQRKHV